MRNVEGLLYWNTTYWADDIKQGSNDPWTDIVTFKPAPQAYGDGSLLYPGSKISLNEPVPSIRLLNIRNGIEDFEYLCLVEKKCGRAVVDQLIAKLSKSMTEYTQDVKELESVREELAQLIIEKNI